MGASIHSRVGVSGSVKHFSDRESGTPTIRSLKPGGGVKMKSAASAAADFTVRCWEMKGVRFMVASSSSGPECGDAMTKSKCRANESKTAFSGSLASLAA